MRLTVWDEPSKLVKGSGSIRYYDPETNKACRCHYQNKEEREREKIRIKAWLLDWKQGKKIRTTIPLVLFEEYLTDLKLGLVDDKGIRRDSTIRIKRESLTKLLESVFDMEHLTTDRIKTWVRDLAQSCKPDSVSIRL